MSNTAKLNPRKVFWKCGTCSQAMFHLLDYEFENHKNTEERASDILAGGIAQKGFQCGMLWGSTLAVGVESFCRHEDKSEATASAIAASQYLLDSFVNRANGVNCSEITGVDFGNRLSAAIYMLKAIALGIVFSPCFNLIVKWTPEAIQAAEKGFSVKPLQNQHCVSCASEVVKKMGANDEEAVMVAGFAGGIGLSGNACGALAAALWYKSLDSGRKNPGKASAMIKSQNAKSILEVFYIQTDSEILCNKICGIQFSSINEHSEYIRNGGCEKLIDALAKL